jgi:hypothetical protein
MVPGWGRISGIFVVWYVWDFRMSGVSGGVGLLRLQNCEYVDTSSMCQMLFVVYDNG